MSSRPAVNRTDPPAEQPRDVVATPPVEDGALSQGAPRRVLAGLLASLVALSILSAFALAWAYPALSPVVLAGALAVSVVCLWGAARVDHARLRADCDRLAADNGRLAERLESLADTAWELRESEERYRNLVDARQRAEAASRAKSRVLATVSHEFRTPLNGILGLTGLLAETELTPDQATYARAVHTSGEALLALVDDMLDFSKIEAGRLDLRPEPTDPEALLDDIAELLAARAHVKDIDVAVETGRDVPAAVLVDPARLRQVLINLAGNAVKFTETGGVTLSVRRAGEERLEFAVADSGPGIPASEAARMFGEFEQMDTSWNRRHGGAGLGLAIAQRIVRRMGGEIAMTPRADGGSVFSFTLDLPAVAGVSASSPAALAGLSVLVLAPDGAEAPALARRLADAGAGVRVVRTLNEAAALAGAATAAGEPQAAVLVDRRAVADPAAALARLREAAGRRLPASVLIEPGARGEVAALKAAGFDAYLVRPVRRTSLLGIVAVIAAGHAPTDFHIDPADERPARAEPRRAAGVVFDVLLAEDNEINALLARAVLEGLGHAVTEVHDGNAAVAAVRDRPAPFGAILMDLHMPGLDGLSAAAAIRAWEAASGSPRAAILAVTADVLADTRAAADAAGIDAVVEKPVTPAGLRRALAEIGAA